MEFGAVSIYSWTAFSALVALILSLDLFVFRRKAHVVRMREALLWSLLWIGCALIFNAYIYFSMGREAAVQFFTGYLIEKSLSVDNLFVFILIFNSFKTPEAALHKVLFWGIIGAIITRAVFILAGISLIQAFHWIIYIFGAFLVLSGIKLLFEKEKTSLGKGGNFFLRLVRKVFRISEDYEGDRFFVRKSGQLFVTPLFVVLLFIEGSDIVFAVDSIPAILAITLNPFIAYTSNIMAVLGLRSLFFVLAGMVKLFRFLHYGIAIILIFIGFKMLISPVWEISTLVTLCFIFVVLLISILLSLPGARSKK